MDVVKSVRGHVDGFDGQFISGWAICDGDDATCLVKVVTPDGREIARGRASHPREDLRDVGRGRTNIAFRIPIKYPANTGALHIAVDDVPLEGSPMAIGRGFFDGGFVVKAGVIQGIVTERTVNAPAPKVRFEDQYGRTVAESLATYSPDRDPSRTAFARFSLSLQPECFGFDELVLRAFANDVSFARETCSARLTGYLDDLSTEQCRGWLLSPDAPLAQFEIEVFCDGERLGGGRCELPREDLKELYPLGWRAGFDLRLKPPRKRSDAPAHISIRLAGTDTELFDGPFLLGERAAMVAAARRAAALARADDRLTPDERHSVQQALADLIAKRRHGPATIRERLDSTQTGPTPPRRLNIVIPIYKGVALTRACIESVLATRHWQRDCVVLVNDRSPDADMARMLADFTGEPGVHLLDNPNNLGFVGSVNRALAFCRTGHVVLLNSDTRVFPGAWDEMERLLDAGPEIGTITAMSNNATIFSYPHPALVTAEPLEDAGWAELADVALATNAGRVVDAPTGHGFCMLVRREVLDRVGHLDTRFGRGYGEENDLCMRAADLGWRNVAASGVLVEHRESVSFGGDKAGLLHANMPQLNALYPEYTPTVMAYKRTDGMRTARWPLDQFRLRRAREAGTRYAVIVQNWLDGGTKTAIKDIEAAYGYEGRERMTLTCGKDGMRELTAKTPVIQVVFAPDEDDALFTTLEEAGVDLVLVHQLLGFTAGFVERLARWGGRRQMKFYMHDFYAQCPRVTMLNAVSRFCEAADVETCARCVAMGGAHEASRMDELTPVEHRELFARLFSHCVEVIAPSTDTVDWAHRAFPGLAVTAAPHPQVGMVFPDKVRDGEPNQIVLLGAIGPHKGSRRLLELAREARLAHPDLRFHVIGYTDIDWELRAVGNVEITGPYEPGDLAALVDRTRARVALFLQEWPETFSYTLSEAWHLGLWPVTPKLGAPARRVTESKFGSVYDASQESLGLILSKIASM